MIMIDDYWLKYINEELTEKESQEFYDIIKNNEGAQKALLDLIHDEALFGQTSDALLLEQGQSLLDHTPTPLPIKKPSRALYALFSMVALFVVAYTLYFTFYKDVGLDAQSPHQTKKMLTTIPKVNHQQKSLPEEPVTIDDIKLPVTLSSVQYPKKATRNPFRWGAQALIKSGPLYSHLNLTSQQEEQLIKVYSSNTHKIMKSYMTHYSQINACPLTCIRQKKHARKNEIEKEMFVWATAHVAMSDTIQKEILKTLDKNQKSNYLNLFKLISKYSDENSHLYKNGSNQKLKENTLEYLKQLQPFLK